MKTFATFKMSVTRRKVYIISFDNPLYPAHWALWIPTIDANGTEQQFGKEIQVEGDANKGFAHGFKGNCNLSRTTRKHQLTFIGLVDSQNIIDGVDDSNSEAHEYYKETDRLEEVALEVAAPPKTLSSAKDKSSVRFHICGPCQVVSLTDSSRGPPRKSTFSTVKIGCMTTLPSWWGYTSLTKRLLKT
jgi:hypothetical protein